MSKSKSKKNHKTEPEEQAQEIVVDVPRETSFIPDEEFSEESKLIEHQPEENSVQAEATIGLEESMTPNVDEVDEANKPSPAILPEGEEAVKDLTAPGEKKEPKRQTYQEIMADRARQQKEIILRNVERNKAIQEARAKKFQENVEAKKAKQ